MRRGRPPFADDPAARRRSSAFFGEMPAPRASTNAASRLASVLGGRARSRDPSPSARRVPTHAVAFGTTVRSPRVSPHVTPRATPQSSPVKAGAAWTASDRYLARVRERERDVRREREGDGDVSDENRSDLFELSDDSIDERVSAVFPSHAQDSKRGSRHARSPSRSRSPGPRSSLDNQDKSPGRVDRRARSEMRESRGASPSPSTAPSPRSARRRVEFVAEKRNPETLESTSVPPEPRGATSVPKPVEATHRNEVNETSLRKRLPKKPELALKKVSPAAPSDRAFVVDAFVRDGDGANSSDGSGVDAAELATPSPEPTRIASRVFEERHDAADAADAKKDVGSLATERAPPESPTLTPSTRLVDSIAARGSGDLLDSVTPAAEEFEATALERGGSGSGSVSFEFAGDAFADDAETSARTLSGVTKYAHTRPHRSPLGSPVRAAHFSPRSSPKTSSPSRRAEAAKTAWVPPGVAPPRAAGEDASPRAANLFASEMFASPLADGHAFSPFSGASEASALSASGSAAKAAAAAARRRFAFAAAVMGDAARFERGSFSAEDREKRARSVSGDQSSSPESPGAHLSGDALNGEKPRSPNTTASSSLVAELLDVARALGEETHARAAEEAARKLAVASARAEARIAALSEANRLKLAKRESAHRLRAACRALRHRLRQWRSHASTTRLVRAAGRKWRAAARRKAETDAFHERRAAAFFAEARLASGLKALRAWRCRTAERRGMATLALLAVTGALMKRTQSAFDAWRREASVAAREKIVGTLLAKKAERFAKKALRRRLAKLFAVWADSSFEARHVRDTVEAKLERTRVLTLGRCVHAWYGVAQRKSNETLAALREVVAEARLRSALRAMADRNRERARIRTWYLTVREKHLRALGHWAFHVTRRALTSWRALAVAGRRTRARRRTFAALKKVVAAQTAEDAFFAFGRSSDDGFVAAANSAFDVSDFPTPSPLRDVFGDESSSGDSGEDLAREKEKRVPRGTSGDEFRKFRKRASVASSKDENASSFARSLRALKTSRRGKEPSCLSRGGSSSRVREPLRPVGSSRLAADAALLARATARLETYAAAPTTPRRVAMKIGAVSAHASTRKKSARRFSFSASALDGTAPRLSPVSFGGYVSPAAARARLWEAPELSESLRELAPTVWRAAFEEGGEKAKHNDARVEDERAAEGEAAGAAERLLELARRGKRRVAWRA
jgi:hypothetical protein